MWQVYLMKVLCTGTCMGVLSKVTISAREYDTLPFARYFNLHAKTQTIMTILLYAFSFVSAV